MLKKIKDLTIEDTIRICRKRIEDGKSCYGCPIAIDRNTCLDMPSVIKLLNEEIEVEDNVKENQTLN